MPLFLGLFLVARGVPVILYRKDLARKARRPFVLYTATTLPLLVAMTDIGVHTGRMNSDVAVALVGAGMLSVLLFPMLAGVMRPTPRAGPTLEVAEETR